MGSCEYLSVGDRRIVSQHRCMRKSGSCDRIQNGCGHILYNLNRTKRNAFDVEDGEETRRSYSNYSSCKEFPAPSHPNVHSSRRRMCVDFIFFCKSTYVPKRNYRCRLIPSVPLPASKGACPYYIGKLRSLVDIGDTSTSRKRFSCTGREQNPLVIGITSSPTLCTSDPVCVNGTRRTEKGYKVLGGSQYRTEATMQRGSLKWFLGDPVLTPIYCSSSTDSPSRPVVLAAVNLVN
ncbi:hypothetical protein ALC62_05753 [Cyphomyrmex costatus]|uniref:Uncharacterized protein n=1 Tax=Cyphomyrmex costatus TaxID=456900 RepID=A0A195CRM7_9HYME|nr:hypothetical protein ALC62_05753 [Cyphomyrmex costatus]